MGERIWTPWFIKFIQSYGYFNIYTNFLHERALSVSHRDAGVNYGKTAGPDSQLLDERSLDFNILEMQPLSSMKWFDFCFREVLPGRVVTNMDELGLLLHSLNKQDSIVLVNLFEVSDSVARNLLCHFERLNMRNYILLVPETDFLFDLARRGHPVINVDQFIQNLGLYKLTSQSSKFEAIKSILGKAYVIKKCMENGYNSWVIDGNVLFLGANLYLDSKDPNYDFFLATSLELFYARSSSTAKKMWDNLVPKVVALAEDLARRSLLSHGDLSFVHAISNLLQQNGARLGRLDETTFGMKIGSGSVNKSSLGDKKLVFWSAEMGLVSIQKCLEEFNLWIIDKESSCTAVVCHKS